MSVSDMARCGCEDSNGRSASRCVSAFAHRRRWPAAVQSPGECSDIDLAIFTPAADTWSLKTRLAVNRAIRKAVDLAVEPHFFGMKAKANAQPTNFVGYILAHGKRIA
jgi:hypothetical protein